MPDPSKLAFAVPAFNSYKEYSRAVATLTVSGNVAAGQNASFSSTVTFAKGESIAFIEFTTSVVSDFHTTGRVYSLIPDSTIFHSNGSTPTFPGTAPYTINFQVTFVDNQATVSAVVNNANAETLTVVTETLTVPLYAVIAPFRTSS